MPEKSLHSRIKDAEDHLIGLIDRSFAEPEGDSQTLAVTLEASPPSDEELMSDVARGDPRALETLYDRHCGILKAVIVRIVHDEAEADDLIQEIFLQIWNRADRFSADKGKALSWIVMVTRRRAIDRLRQRQAYGRARDRLEVDRQVNGHGGHDRGEDINQADLRSFLREKMVALPAAQIQVVEMAFFQGLSQREIARRIDAPLGTVKTRIELALRKLHDAVRDLRDEL